MQFLRRAVFALLFGSATFLMLPKAAQADPHAMFYTVVGQQQLFYNVLAALDQADYVEPGQNTLGTAPNDSREELLRLREDAGFGPEADERITSTKTDLASVLTRSITLEGNDLWTTYMAHQFAIEAARRRGLNEVLKVWCERGLGLQKCDEQGQQAGSNAIRNESAAFVNNPTRDAAVPYFSGITGAIGGAIDADVDKEIRHELKDPDKNKEGIPYDQDENITELASNTKSKGELAGEVSKLMILNLARAFLPATVEPTAYSNLNLSDDGNISLAFSASKTGTSSAFAQESGSTNVEPEEFIIKYGKTLSGITSQPARLASSLSGSYERARLQSAELNEDGTKPDKKPIERKTEGSSVGEIRTQVTTPVRSRLSTLDAIGQAATDVEVSLQDARPIQEKAPGQRKAVEDRASASRANPTDNDAGNENNPDEEGGEDAETSSVLGTSDSKQPRVAAASDEVQADASLDTTVFTPLNPGTDTLRHPVHDISDPLQRFSNGDYFVGCTCGLMGGNGASPNLVQQALALMAI